MLQGMLLVGFSKEHGTAASKWLQEMEPGFRVSYCTADVLAGTVQQAVMKGCDILQFRQEEHAPMDEVLPRLVLLSGMSGEEAIAIAEHWEDFTGMSTLFQTVQYAPLAFQCMLGSSGAYAVFSASRPGQPVSCRYTMPS